MADFERSIPKNTDKLLFAEDLVGYVMTGFDRSYRYPTTAEPYRRYVHTAFSDVVRHAVVFLCMKFNRSNFLKYEVLKELCRFDDISQHFNDVADDLHIQCFNRGVDARKFLFFCAQVSSMAGVFYVFGTRDAPEMAVRHIEHSIQCFPMQSGAWDTVNAIAREISKLNRFPDRQFDVGNLVEEFKKCDSPRCSSPESMRFSDDEDTDEVSQSDTMLIVDLREFANIDEAWRDEMIKKYKEDMTTSSDDSSSAGSEEANGA